MAMRCLSSLPLSKVTHFYCELDSVARFFDVFVVDEFFVGVEFKGRGKLRTLEWWIKNIVPLNDFVTLC